MFWLLDDVRHALRALLSAPGFTVAAVLTMALGIGVNTGIFSILNDLVLRDVPAPNAQALVDVHQEVRGIRRPSSGYGNGFATYEYEVYRDRAETLSGLIAYSATSPAVLGGATVREVLGTTVSCNYFGVLQQPPTVGRSFSADACDHRRPAAEVVLGHDLWVSAFGADEGVLNTDVMLNGQRFTVAGVAPEGFHGVDFVRASFFVPIAAQGLLRPDRDLVDAEISWLTLVGRLAPGFTRQQAAAELRVLAGQIDQQEPGRETTLLVSRATPFGGPYMMRRFVMSGPALVLAAFFFVLVIACTNVANLVLARGDVRIREISVRLALGATRGRLIRQLLLESAIIGLIGGLVGSLLALWVFEWLSALVLSSMTGEIAALQLDPSPDARVLGFAFLLSLGTGIVAGLAPALKMSKPNLRAVMERDSAGAGHQTRGRVQGPLIGVQVALSMMLVIATALLLRGLYVAQTADLGFDYRELTVAAVDLDGFSYDEDRAAAFQQQWVERVEALPGVEEVAQTLIAPLSLTDLRRFYLGAPGMESNVLTTTNLVSPNYFSVAGIPIVRGRTFTEAELRERVSTAVLVTESTARRFWPGEDPIGQSLRIPQIGGDGEDNVEVIGVVADRQVQNIGETDTPYVYLPAAPSSQAELKLLIRSPLEAPQLERSVAQIVADLDPSLLARVAPLEENVDSWRRLSALASGISLGVGALALVLASIGIFGVMSSAVGRRIREIGIRLAVGAGKRDILELVLRRTMPPIVVGAAIGTIACILVARAMSAMLFGVSAFDPYALAAALVVVFGAALAASIIPARRAMSVDPMTTLRYE